MLRLAGRMADGTVTFMTGPRTLATFTCPTILDAAERAGRPRPRIVVLVAVCVTDHAERGPDPSRASDREDGRATVVCGDADA